MKICIYTVSDLKKWIYCNVDVGLDTSMISNARALALIQNPCAEDSDPAIAIAYDEYDSAVGYTAVLADIWHGKKIFFGTTGFIDASMRGKGVGTRLYSAMMEACGNRWFASDSAPAALTISKKTGLGIYYFERYYLKFSYSSKSLVSLARSWYVRKKNSNVYKRLKSTMKLEILRYIDTETYRFIEQYSKVDIFQRSQAMLNWILQSPFKVAAPKDLATYSKYDFTTALPQYMIYAFRIMMEKKIIGFAMFRLNMGDLGLLYLYKDNNYTEEVHTSLLKHILEQNICQFRTFDKSLLNYFESMGAVSMNAKSRIQQISLSVPAGVSIDKSLVLQGGDGDMFC